jgi:hypothetical protein
MPKYTVELDYRGTYQTEIDASSPAEAYQWAKRELEANDGDGDLSVDRVDSFQVFDESFNVCDVNE